MNSFQPRALHLHTLESLLADLVSGRPIIVGDDVHFSLPDTHTRSALEWYRAKGPTTWAANVSRELGENLVSAIQNDPPVVNALAPSLQDTNLRQLTLKKVEAHRFAGLHKYGTPETPPKNFIFDFSKKITLFEGRNGSGKTSLANAIIWALTGEILRPQREPEPANDEFECSTNSPDTEEAFSYRQTPVTPLPDVVDFQPSQKWIPADTWVELTFIDEDGVELPPLRRSQSRTPKGKLTEEVTGISTLEVDPIALRIGTVMPGLLPLIQLGSESEIGRAISQLTGLSSLVGLSDHVRRAKQKIEKEFKKSKISDIENIDSTYTTAKSDLEEKVTQNPEIKPETTVPPPSEDKNIEAELDKLVDHFNNLKSTAFESATSILGKDFDPADVKARSNLETDIGPALSEIRQLRRLPSIKRLSDLRHLSAEDLDAASTIIDELLEEAEKLSELAKNPTSAARLRLYARITTWIADHPDPNRIGDNCVVCGTSIIGVADPVTGTPITDHLAGAEADAKLLSQTLEQWSEAALGLLTQNLPNTLSSELKTNLPDHPYQLIRKGIIDELFDTTAFTGVLQKLKDETATAFDNLASEQPELATARVIELPQACMTLAQAVGRLDKAIRFAKWRQENEELARSLFDSILGHAPKDGEEKETSTLTGKLLDLEATVKAALPLSDALTYCDRLKKQMALRRTAENRLREYDDASDALTNLLPLGDLAGEQVQQLRSKLKHEAAQWRDRIYLGAFPSTAHELVDTPMGKKGELGLTVRTGGISAPAQHVTNASALRASLVGFYFAFWEHVLTERGGINLIILDDPQELLDDENRERLADSFKFLVDGGGQLAITSYDPRFCGLVARIKGIGGVDHREVRPATRLHPRIEITLPRVEVVARKKRFDESRDSEEAAQEYADACRVFLEGKLGDLFDDPAFSTWVKENAFPTLSDYLGRLRHHVNDGPQSMFNARPFKKFATHSALVDDSPVIQLMNKAHHGNRREIRSADVAQCVNDLEELTKLVEEMHEECLRWRRRDAPPKPTIIAPAPLTPLIFNTHEICVCPDLAAFTQHFPSGGTQDSAEALDPALLDGKVIYYLRRDNFGFAAPSGTLAIVEAEQSSSIRDRRLVIARYGDKSFARRLLKSTDSNMVGLTAEIPDPRTKTPRTLFLPEMDVALHQVIGVLFDHKITVDKGSDEAVLIDDNSVLDHISVAFRIIDESAIPLALPGQVVLGGRQIPLNELTQYRGHMFALMLEDGASLFKRLGAFLPGELSHLVQLESIGGLGSSQILSVDKDHPGLQRIVSARMIMGVMYHG